MQSFSEYIGLEESITFDDDMLKFLYGDGNSGDALVSTSFGKDKKLKPYKKKILDGLTAYSLYNSKKSTTTLKAIKAADFTSDDVQYFLTRSAIYGERILRDHKPDIIVTPKSSSDLVKKFTEELRKRNYYDYYIDSFQKVPDLSKVKIDRTHPKITVTIADGMQKILDKAVANGFLSLKTFPPQYRKFITNLFEITDEKLRKKVEGKNVMIIDDIMTSGTTARQIYDILKAHGADNITSMTLFKAS